MASTVVVGIFVFAQAQGPRGIRARDRLAAVAPHAAMNCNVLAAAVGGGPAGEACRCIVWFGFLHGFI